MERTSKVKLPYSTGPSAALACDCARCTFRKFACIAFCACFPQSGRTLTVRVQAYGMKAEYIWADGNEGKPEKVGVGARTRGFACGVPWNEVK